MKGVLEGILFSNPGLTATADRIGENQ